MKIMTNKKEENLKRDLTMVLHDLNIAESYFDSILKIPELANDAFYRMEIKEKLCTGIHELRHIRNEL